MNEVPDFSVIAKRRHRVYSREDIKPVVDYLGKEFIPYGAITQTKIPISTLADWRKKRREVGNEDWLPDVTGPRPERRVFDSSTEESITRHIIDCFMVTGIGATLKTVREVALQAYSTSETHPTERFCASTSWMTRYMKEKELVLRRPILKEEQRSTRNMLMNSSAGSIRRSKTIL